MIVALKSLNPASQIEASQARHLRWLASLDPQCAHSLTDDEQAADAILLTDAVGGPRLVDALLHDRSIQAHWPKVFIHSEEARPFRLVPGLYTSLPRRAGDEDFARAIGYPCWTPNAMNLCIDQSAERPPERDPDLLYSFVGRRSHRVRDRLFAESHRAETTHVADSTSTYRHFAGDATTPGDAQRRYVDIALRSRFALCPRGWATSTLRLYEMMALGVAPVVLADRWVAPRGPDWARCAVFIPERQVADIPRILEERQDEWRTLGAAAFEAFREYFAPRRQFRTLSSALAELAPVAEAGRRRLKRRWAVTLPTVAARPYLRSVARRKRVPAPAARVANESAPASVVSARRGYLTMAVRSEHYLEMAVDMALSLREHTELPVAIAVDDVLGPVVSARYTSVFDSVVAVPPRFLDGRALKYGCAEASPFEETIFVDADCVVLGRLDRLVDALANDDFAMLGEQLTTDDDQMHHGFSTRALMTRFGLDRYLKTNSGLFCFRKPAAIEIMDDCLECYLTEARPALRGSILMGRWLGDEIAFGIVGGRRRLGTLPPPAPMYWPREIERIDLESPAKPLLHMLWPLPEAALERLVADTGARRRRAGVPGDSGLHWRREARSLEWMARRQRIRDRLAHPLRRPHIG
jgi:hypothetical protein